MSARNITLDEFLAPVSVALGHSSPAENIDELDTQSLIRPHVTDGLSHEELIQRFIDESHLLGIDVRRATVATISDIMRELVEENGGGAVIADANARLDDLGIADACKKASNTIRLARWNPQSTRDENIEQAEMATIGVTFAYAAIAETGTVVQPCSDLCGRSVSLLPAVHIAVIDAATIEPSMIAVLRRLEKERADGQKLPSQICFISGPSNTADIELVRVEGVHGPTKVCYLILDD